VPTLLAVIVAAVAATWLPAAAASATNAPASWDPAVERFVRFVEKERGLQFDHPVRVRFLDDAAFRRRVAAWSGDETAKQRELDALEASDVYALGLASEVIDLGAAQAASDETDVLGFYDEETKEMVVRGRDLSDTDVRMTVVHELTHALQDQHFGLRKLERKAGGPGLDALVEGDADLVAYAYLYSLPKRTQDAYFDAPPEVDSAEPAVPSARILELWDMYPYDFGYSALQVAMAAHGHAALDALFRDPPASEEQIIDPVALERDDRPKAVRFPTFASGDEAKGPADSWGALSWYLLLSSRIPWRDALVAAEGWGGDRYRSFVRHTDAGDRWCVRLSVTGDSSRDTDELEHAIRAWSDAMPGGGTTVSRAGSIVTLDACATDTAPTSVDEAVQTAYDRLWERTDQMWSVVDRSHPPDRAGRCVVDTVVADDDVEPLLSADHDLAKADRRRIDHAYDEAWRACL